jgi:hypothetical protein
MSFCFIILFVTIWCEDNKLIIYLFYWVSISGIGLLGVMYRRFPLTHEFQNIYLYETGKVAVSANILSSIILWRRILHE